MRYAPCGEQQCRIDIFRIPLLMADLCLMLCLCFATYVTSNDSTNNEVHQDEWVVRIEGGAEVAALLALEYGYKHHGPVLGFEDTYVWIKNDKVKQDKRNGAHPKKLLSSQSKILWADEQRILQRQKRGEPTADDSNLGRTWVRKKSFRRNANQLLQIMRIMGAEKNEIAARNNKKPQIVFNDECWREQWYLQGTEINEGLPKLDLNVLPLYRLGITGRGVRVAVLDDGLEYTHDDLRNNYDPEISYDINEGDSDPMPRYVLSGKNRHGTRCAGEIAMEANNQKCGVGVAFEASIGGIKLLDGKISDRVEAEALRYRTELIDVYTASWGPEDNGKTMEAPGRLGQEALEHGITKGRNGKGSIYVWASGNGGKYSDHCGCDGYVGSIYTVAIASASQAGKFPWYGEKCPAIMATTCSSGATEDRKIATTDLMNNCTTSHTGTSAAAPLAAGILALALQVNKELTWRDIQHLIVWTSDYSPLRENNGWFKNAAGFWFNTRFGFGLMNAYALVMSGYKWERVPEKSVCAVNASDTEDRFLTYGKKSTVQFYVGDGCLERGGGDNIVSLEHVEIEANLDYTCRGALQMHLKSPSGTKVEILSPRKLDDSRDGFQRWKFMSLASWGEDPRGTWSLDILDEVGPEYNNGTILEFTLILHGTTEVPAYRKHGPRMYENADIKSHATETEQVDSSSDSLTLGCVDHECNPNSKTVSNENIFNWIKRMLYL